MLTNIPSSADYLKNAERFLSSAWIDAQNFVDYELRRAEEVKRLATVRPVRLVPSDAGGVEIVLDEQADVIQPETHREEIQDVDALAVAHIVAFTGVEHLLRAQVASITPLLLLGDPVDWAPKSDGPKNVPFDTFRSVDARTLIPILNSVRKQRVNDRLVQKIDDLRTVRNTLSHGPKVSPPIAAGKLIELILWVTDELVGPRTWMNWRRKCLKAVEDRDGGHSFSWRSSLNSELNTALSVLTPATALKFLGVQKRKRRYFCPRCLDGSSEIEDSANSFIPGVAQLDASDTRLLRCVACDADTKVHRAKCRAANCKGNVLAEADDDPDSLRCMTCASRQEYLSD